MSGRSISDEDSDTSSVLTMAVSPCLMVERQIPYRSERSKDGIPETTPETISKASSPIWGMHPT
eukprot:6057574-Amphidinium_carterae.1